MRQDASMATMNSLSQEYRGAADARSLLQIVLERYDWYRSDNLPAWPLANSHDRKDTVNDSAQPWD